MMDKQSRLIEQLENIISEGRNPQTMDIDLLSTDQLLNSLNQQDQLVPLAVQQTLPQVALAVDKIVEAFNQGGRLIYIGAGTSGRLGILDAVECRPTFSIGDNQVIGIIAGGNQAIYRAVEGAEDDGDLAISDLKKVNMQAQDVVVGIAASGRTPYVISALNYANELGATSVCVTCNPQSPLVDVAAIAICAVVGPEALTGSTRLKSGSAQKLILNMLTTASMIKIGKSYQNLMVDVNASNEKLYARAVRIVMQASECDYATAKAALAQANHNAKMAILLILTGVSVEEGQSLLAQHHGFLRHAVTSAPKK